MRAARFTANHDPAVQVSEEQKAIIQAWADEGATLNDVQKRLKEELGISITYLEARFLLSDLGITLTDARAAEREKEKAREEALAAGAGAGLPGGDDEGFADAEVEPAGGGGSVSVSVDNITQPGTIVSGQVTFSGGEKARWYLDQLGRLGLDPDDPAFRPSEADVMDFQRKLQDVMSRQGF